jgi:SanA protein
MVKSVLYGVIAGIALVLVLFGLINAGMVWVEEPHMYAGVSDVPERIVIIVPGAAVLRNGGLSAVFLDRANAAIVLYQAGKGQKILVSGDSSTANNEVDPARKYLVAQGIPAKDIYLDPAGFDTYSTMYRASHIFGVTSAIVATQSFHLPRALFLARSMGIDAVGYRADNVHLLARNDWRESLARIKALWDTAAGRIPAQVGDMTPI